MTGLVLAVVVLALCANDGAWAAPTYGQAAMLNAAGSMTSNTISQPWILNGKPGTVVFDGLGNASAVSISSHALVVQGTPPASSVSWHLL